MKKVLAIIIAIILLVGFTGCGKDSAPQKSAQEKNVQQNTEVQTVQFDSDPENSVVYIDETPEGTTPCSIKVTIGKHNIVFRKSGYKEYPLNNVEIREDTHEIKATLKKIDEKNIIRITNTKLNDALLNAPSKFVFISNNRVYISNKEGKNIEEVAVLDNHYQARLYDLSPDSKWLILNISGKGSYAFSKTFLYALNIEKPEIIKIAEDDWEGGFRTSFRGKSDKLIYGFQGVNAPICRLASFDFATKKTSYLLDCSKNSKEKAFDYDISPDGKYIVYAGGNVEIFPDNRTALYLKNLETGKLKMLVKPSNIDPNSGSDFISNVSFINGGKAILYSREIWLNASNSNSIVKYFIVDLEGHKREISAKEALKFTKESNQIVREELSKKLNRNVHIYAVLDACRKIVFTAYNKEGFEELYTCNTDFSAVYDTGISDPNLMKFYDNCKFTCELLTNPEGSKTIIPIWYLIDSKNNTRVNLNEFFNRNISDIMYIEKH